MKARRLFLDWGPLAIGLICEGFLVAEALHYGTWLGAAVGSPLVLASVLLAYRRRRLYRNLLREPPKVADRNGGVKLP